MKTMTRYAILVLSTAALTATFSTAVCAQTPPVDPAATEILKRMTDCMGRLEKFSVDSQCTLEETLETGSRVDFDVSARATVKRPNKIRSERRGDIIDQRFYYNGKTLTLWNPTDKVYATVPAPDTIEGTLHYVRDSLELIIPASDLVYPDSYSLLMQDVTFGMLVGKAVINGTKCDHLLFSRPGVDFQVWVADKGKPLPMKYVVTDTATPARLSLVTVMDNWDTSPRAKDSDFEFKPPRDAEPITFLPLIVLEETNR